VISQARIQHRAASNVSRIGRGAARRSEGYERAARARHASTNFSLASVNKPAGRPSARTAASPELHRSGLMRSSAAC
jgi:hypothetical protein